MFKNSTTVIAKHVLKNRMAYIMLILSLIILASVMSVTFAVFSDTKDRSIEVNFNAETSSIDAQINPEETNIYSDVTLLKMWHTSEGISSTEVLSGGVVTIKQSQLTSIKVRFKLGFEFYDNATVSSPELKTILTYLNSSINYSSVVATNPFSTYEWKQLYSSGGDKYYYLCENSSSISPYNLNSSLQDFSLKLLSAPITYSGIDALNLNINALDSVTKEIFNKLSFVVQVEIAESGESFTQTSPTYTYNKVAIFNSNGGTNVPAINFSSSSFTAPTTSKTGYTFNGWYTTPAFTAIAGVANSSITQSYVVATYYAKFTENAYTVTLNPNGGSVYGSTSNYEISNVTYNSNFISSSAITTKTGYDFLGYFDSNDANSGKCYIDSNGMAIRTWDKTQNATLYARYSSAKTYNIIYTNMNGVEMTNSVFPYQYTYGTTVSVPNAQKDGYTFNGWTVSNNGATTNNVTSYTISSTTYGTIYLSPTFSAITYTATITDGAVINYTISGGLTLTALSIDYCGYKVSSSVGNWKQNEIYPAGQTISNKYGNVTLTKVLAEENIILDLNTTDEEAFAEILALGIGTQNATLVLPNAYCPNYIFSGWYFSSSCNNNELAEREYEFDASDFATERRLYAKWVAGTPTYTVNLNNDNGNNTTTTLNLCSTNLLAFSLTSTLPIPTKSGYIFDGYYTEPNGQGTQFYDKNGNAQITELNSSYLTDYEYNTFTLYASYTQKTYTITFNTDGGAQNFAPQNYIMSQAEEIKVPTPSKFGYQFSCWRVVSMSSDANWDSLTPITTSLINVTSKCGDVTLLAEYTPITYTITLNFLMTGTTLPIEFTPRTTKTTYSIETPSITLPEPDMLGHTFIGWQISAGAGAWTIGEIIPANALTKVLSNAYYGDVTLTAKFSVTIFEIEFEYVDDEGNNLALQANNPTSYTTYVNATKSIYFSYLTTSVQLLNQLSFFGSTFSKWSPTSNVGGWLTLSEYEPGETISITADKFHNVTMRSVRYSAFGGGDGSYTTPFIISTQKHLQNLSDLINNDETYPMYASLNYTLNNNINMVGVKSNRVVIAGVTYISNFISIGTQSNPFKGNFNGENHVITGLKTSATTSSASGLFGHTNGATISNINLHGAIIASTSNNNGCIIGYAENKTIIENCKVLSANGLTSKIVTTGNPTGGIVGKAERTIIKNCRNEANVSSYTSTIGGIIGQLRINSAIANCSNYGNVSIMATGNGSYYDVGGLIGKMGESSGSASAYGSCVAINLYNTGDVTTVSTSSTGSIGSCIGYKGYACFALNIYNDGNFNYISGTTSLSKNSVIGAGRWDAQNNASTASNGILNTYYKQNTFKIDSVNSNVRTITGCYLTEDEIIGGAELSLNNGDLAKGVTTSNQILNSNSFASLATEQNAWIYDIINVSGFVAPVYYLYGNGTGVTYESIASMLVSVGISLTELNYWIKTSPTEIGHNTSSSYMCEENKSSQELRIIQLNLNGGAYNVTENANTVSTTKRIYSALSINGTKVYADSEKLYYNNFVRNGYVLKGLYPNIDGTGTPLTLTQDYYTIEPNVETSSFQTYYAIWEKQFMGSGTEDDPYVLSDGKDLSRLSYLVRTNASNGFFRTAYYQQACHIHLEGLTVAPDDDATDGTDATEQLVPIGTATYPFQGHYDGSNRTIYCQTSNICLTYTSNTNIGIFGVVQNATIENIYVEMYGTLGTANTSENIAVIIGKAINSTIQHAYAQNTPATIQGKTNIGGVVGYATTTGSNKTIIIDCYDASILTTSYAGGIVGGIVALADGNTHIENCNKLAKRKATSSGSNGVAGAIVGKMADNARVENCITNGNVEGNTAYCGKIVGYISSTTCTAQYLFSEETQSASYNLIGTSSTAYNTTANTIQTYTADTNGTLSTPLSITYNAETYSTQYLLNIVRLHSMFVSTLRTNYYLGAWNSSGNCTFQPTSAYANSRQVTFITNATDAVFTKNCCIHRDYNTAITVPEGVPTKTDYIFGGWYTEPNGGGTKIINEDNTIANSITITGDICLYAKWT